MSDLQKYATKKNIPFPIPPEKFNETMYEFATENRRGDIYVVNNKFRGMRI